jgi:transposase
MPCSMRVHGAAGDAGAIEAQIARLDRHLKALVRRSPVCRRLMSVPGVGPIVALAFMATIEDVGRFRRMRDMEGLH